MAERDHNVDEQSLRRDEPIPEATRRGQWWATPFVILGSVAALVWTVAGILTLALLLIWWLG